MTDSKQTDTDAAVATPFSSNAMRLSMRDWVIATSVLLLAMILTPIVWRLLEPFAPPPDFRVPYDLSDDYWVYQRLVDRTIRDKQILVIGDSVVWGEYVDPQHTLSHNLNELHGESRFANGGLNGTHPLALQGLVQYYANDVRATRVVLHCNLLWMSSAERDLQSEKEMTFNHPRLVPQFVPRIPCYKADAAERMGIAIDRYSSLRLWVNHLRVADFEGLDIHSWTLEHPYENPIERIRSGAIQPQDKPHSLPIVWTERGMQPQDIPWIDLDTSLQWRAFRDTAKLLRDRGNSVFVIIGPFNEHLLTRESQDRYHTMSHQAEAWLDEREIAYYAATALPSDEYADASHPLAAGYIRLAEQVYEQPEFQRWLGGVLVQ
ncbi:MAG: hypothetical protein ABI614_18800 [Planctomycetota bacterium]